PVSGRRTTGRPPRGRRRWSPQRRRRFLRRGLPTLCALMLTAVGWPVLALADGERGPAWVPVVAPAPYVEPEPDVEWDLDLGAAAPEPPAGRAEPVTLPAAATAPEEPR